MRKISWLFLLVALFSSTAFAGQVQERKSSEKPTMKQERIKPPSNAWYSTGQIEMLIWRYCEATTQYGPEREQPFCNWWMDR
ncbi:TPA: hypothetical protein DD617_00345 [Candidatus Uhrbacteria bacterium]|nr:hypothetical protein [Candidatus Uhrbacteria bacterium]